MILIFIYNKHEHFNVNSTIKLSPITGFEPIYNPDKFNIDKHVRRSHNCYSYMLNDVNHNLANLCKYSKCRLGPSIDGINPQPGHYSGIVNKVERSETKCDVMLNRVYSDNPEIYPIEFNEKCKPHYYKGALTVNPGVTYHFYRQDRDGNWSHKDGNGRANNVDASNNIITNPQTANRFYTKKRHYKDFCGFFCIPSDYVKQTNMSRRDPKNNNKLY